MEALPLIEVDEEGIAAEKGVKPGDIISSANYVPVRTKAGFLEVIKKAKETDQSLAILITRGGRPIFLSLPKPE